MSRPRKYPINNIAVGQSITIPWIVGHPTQDPIYCAIRQEQRRFGKLFQTFAYPTGVIVKRVK